MSLCATWSGRRVLVTEHIEFKGHIASTSPAPGHTSVISQEWGRICS